MAIYASIDGPADFAGRYHHAQNKRLARDEIINLERHAGAFGASLRAQYTFD